jgi:hypothetical protein
MTEEEQASVDSLAALSKALQDAMCDDECQREQEMTRIIIILSVVAISMLFCCINVGLVWKGYSPFCCCCSCTFGGLFPLKSRVEHYKRMETVHEEVEDDSNEESGENSSLVTKPRSNTFQNVKIYQV